VLSDLTARLLTSTTSVKELLIFSCKLPAIVVALLRKLGLRPNSSHETAQLSTSTSCTMGWEVCQADFRGKGKGANYSLRKSIVHEEFWGTSAVCT
jgi:hypothetical protein